MLPLGCPNIAALGEGGWGQHYGLRALVSRALPSLPPFHFCCCSCSFIIYLLKGYSLY